jgi:hypothetical protein
MQKIRNILGLALFPLLVAASLPAAAQGVSKDTLRRALLDHCVYTESGKPNAPKDDRIVDACQCASQQTARAIRDADLAGLQSVRSVPDEWVAALRANFANCRR